MNIERAVMNVIGLGFLCVCVTYLAFRVHKLEQRCDCLKAENEGQYIEIETLKQAVGPAPAPPQPIVPEVPAEMQQVAEWN